MHTRALLLISRRKKRTCVPSLADTHRSPGTGTSSRQLTDHVRDGEVEAGVPVDDASDEGDEFEDAKDVGKRSPRFGP